MLATTSGPRKFNQNNTGDNNKCIESYCNEKRSVMGNQNGYMLPGVNFTSSIVMTTSALTLAKAEEQAAMLKKNTDIDVTTNKNDQYIYMKAALDSTTNCKPEIYSNSSVPDQSSIASQTRNDQRSSQDRPDYIFGTKVTKLNLFVIYTI